MSLHNVFDGYLNDLKAAMAELDLAELDQIVKVLQEAHRHERQVFVFGNGGSSSTASHMAGDLTKTAAVPGQKRMRVISLTDNVALMTAIGNDIFYEDIFVQQLMGLWHQGDVAIGISASGNSPNVLKAIEYANRQGGTTIGFVGFGGKN